MIREWILGRVHTRPPKEKTKQGWRECYWRYPGYGAEAPIMGGAEGILLKARFILGIAPGWKLVINTHLNADPLPDPHVHSGRFISLILSGGYEEERVDGRTGFRTRIWHAPWTFNYIPEYVYHRVTRLPKGKAVTLALIFPNIQEHGWWSQDKFTSMGRYFGEGRHLTPA